MAETTRNGQQQHVVAGGTIFSVLKRPSKALLRFDQEA